MNVSLTRPGDPVKPALLFLSPVMPATGGSGIAMRAGSAIEALAAVYDVHLLVIPVTGAPTPGAGVPAAPVLPDPAAAGRAARRG